MMGPTAALLPDGKRLHLHHGPIDLIIGADGDQDAAFAAATARFATVLTELVDELPVLRKRTRMDTAPAKGTTANRMHAATRPFCTETFITPMAAVAGSVADDVLNAMCTADLDRAYVNNGGDIALFIARGQEFTTAIAGHDGTDLGRVRIKDTDPVRGIATSGRHGRSHSLGIADSVTVLAENAARADAAATLIANRVDLPGHPSVTRCPASDITDDSDLGDLAVVTDCGPLTTTDVDRALTTGLARAEAYQKRNLIVGASIFLQGDSRTTQMQNITGLNLDMCLT